MSKCILCGKLKTKGGCPFFKVPQELHRIECWRRACGITFAANKFVCVDHFASTDLIYGGRRTHLMPNAIPTLQLKELNITNIDAVTNPNQQYPVYIPAAIGSLPATSNLQTTNTSSPIYVTTTLPEEDTKKDELINEALFDNEESEKQHQISVDDAGNTINPLSTSIEIKTEENTPECPTTETLLITSTTFPTTTGSQTDEASEDRMNCGFVNVSKSGPDKYFNLRCFYCDVEYPITFWSEFSDHILYNHNHLERKYNKSDGFMSTTSDHNKPNDIDEMDVASDSTTEEELPTIDFISLVNNKINETNQIPLIGQVDDSLLKDSLPNYGNVNVMTEQYVPLQQEEQQQYVFQTKYELNIEHNYSQTPSNKSRKDVIDNADESIDEITFDNSPRDIIIDFLNNIKGLPSLWLDRKLHPINYDRELLALMDIMKIRWNLNLTIDHLCKNWENIKVWFNTMRTAREMSGDNNVKPTFSEYYDICEEFLTFEGGNKQNNRCDRCKHIAINSSQLQVHKYSKHKIGLPPYKCHKCNKIFIYIENMLKHLRKHVENKANEETAPTETDFKCFECDQNFVCAKEYKLHLDIHPKGDRPYGCEECGNRFKDISKRNEHQRRHKSAGYQCEFCPAILRTGFAFRTHTNAHKGIYEYICEWCGRPFVCRNKWWEHVKYAHMGHGLCKICNREYKKSSILHKHLRNMHRPLIGTIEELTKRRKGVKRRGGVCLNGRKYEYVIDPVTKVRRLKCPKCDKSFLRHRNVGEHALKIHNYDMRNLPRGKWQKNVKNKILNNESGSDTNAATATADYITEYTVTKSENGDSNDPTGEEACLANHCINANKSFCMDTVFEGNEIQVDKRTKANLFEKFVDEITSQSSSNSVDGIYEHLSAKVVAPLVATLPDSESNEFELILNTEEISNFLLISIGKKFKKKSKVIKNNQTRGFRKFNQPNR